jgi:hypothetical protein
MARRRPTQLSQRQVEALTLRAAGATYEQIGRALRTNRGNAWRLVQRALPPLERSEDELRLELFRIDQALMSIWPQVRQGDLQAVQTFARLTETRARVRSRFYEQRNASVVVNNYNQLNTQGVLVIKGETKEEYIQGLRQARGELPPPHENGSRELPAPSTDE